MDDLSRYKNTQFNSSSGQSGGNSGGGSSSGGFSMDDVSGIASGLSSIISTATDIADDGDPNFEDELNRIRNQTFSPSGTYSLMNQYNNMYLGAPKTWSDFGGKTSGDYAKGIFSSTLSGTATGAKYGPYGAFTGFVLGLGAGTIGMFSNQAKAKANEKYYYNKKNENFNIALNNWNTANDALKTNQFDRALKGFYQSAEDGGLLSTHGSDFTNNIKYINVGGTHEQNPNRGVQMGVDEEGTPNLVEEGEVIFNDYVFSARLKPSKKALNDSLIGDKYLGLTYAEIAEKLAEKSEEMPNDKIEQNTLNANFSRLITIQEEQRAKKQEREANEFKGGGPTKRGSNYFYGPGYVTKNKDLADLYYKVVGEYLNVTGNGRVGFVTFDGHVWPNKLAANRHAKQKAAEVWEQYKQENGISREFLSKLDKGEVSLSSWNNDEVSAMEAELEQNYPIKTDEQITEEASQVAQETVGKSDKSGATATSNPTSRSSSSTRRSSSTGNLSSGQIPYNRNLNGEDFESQQYYQDFLKYMDSIKDTPEAQAWIDRINSGEFGNMNGYKINSYSDWLRLATDKKVGPVHNATLAAAEMAAKTNNRKPIEAIQPKQLQGEPTLESVLGVEPETLHDVDRERISTYTGPGVEGEGENKDYSYLLRYAPVLGNALALLGNRKDYSDVRRFEAATANPRTVRFSPIGTYIRPNLVAPSELSVPIENQMANERNYISNNSLGNSTTSNNYMLASDYLGNSRIGAAYLQGKQYNAEQRQKAAAYNLGIDQYNSEGAFKEQQQNMSLNNYYLQRALSDYQMRNNIDMAYNQARSSNLTALFNNLGNIGLDTFNRNRANAASPAYNYEGRDGFIRYMLDYYDSLYGKDNNNGQ